MTQRPLLILIAGPYRSGTGDDPAKMAANLRRLESVAVPLFRAGHIPMIGEWVALPLMREASCSVPAFDGTILAIEWKDALWAKFFTGAPRQRRQSVERYNIVKRA